MTGARQRLGLPTSCYRLQMRNGMDFGAASDLVPYFARLGISHLYISPIFRARSGSEHGYDVTDPNEVEPGLGGLAGLEALSEALRRAEMGLILDIVPNHLAFSTETPWLRDVLRQGAESRYSRHFDFDPGAERIRLPWLEAPFEELVQAGTFAVEEDPDGPVLVTGGLRVPLAHGHATPGTPTTGDLRALHAAQHWRLSHWRTEADALSHRRFFNVTDLVGVRVEDETVFEDSHRLLFRIVDDGIVDGLRIDHVDGLADPARYLARLRRRTGGIPIWVEKILAGQEALPEEWPVEGTTGYVAARAITRLLTDAAGLDRIDDAYRAATDRTEPIESVIRRARTRIMTRELASELWTLHRHFSAIAAEDPIGCEMGPESLRDALLSFIAAFPRYRTYATDSHVSPADADLIARVGEKAAGSAMDSRAVHLLTKALTRTDPGTADFRRRFQQVTGAAVAKSQEDTAFYREVRLLSLNEVGSEPDDDALGASGFHRAMRRRIERMPQALSLTSSHDTKRSEDARMRIAAITHHPDLFTAWHRICQGFAPRELNPNVVWYVAQTFLALDQSDGHMGDRLAGHVVKALREAKSESFWTEPDLDLEETAASYVRRLADHFPSHASEVGPILAAADRLTLVQTAIKLTMPGIPDIYQGCELAFYALTDPDNRRPVDFDLRRRALDDPDALHRPLDRLKFDLVRTLLTLRRDRPGVFLSGTYHEIEAEDGICAYARRHEGDELRVYLATGAQASLRPYLQGDDRKATRLWPSQALGDQPVAIALHPNRASTTGPDGLVFADR